LNSNRFEKNLDNSEETIKKKKQKIKFAFLFQNKEERNASFLSRLFDCCIFGPREQKEKMEKEEEENNCLLEI
jgi:hypothetical protein